MEWYTVSESVRHQQIVHTSYKSDSCFIRTFASFCALNNLHTKKITTNKNIKNM